MTVQNPLEKLKAGSRYRLRFTAVDADNGNVVLNLTGYTAKFSIGTRDSTGILRDPILVKDSSNNSDVTLDNNAGQVDVVLKSEDTENVTPGDYHYELWITNVGGQSNAIAEGRVALQSSFPR